MRRALTIKEVVKLLIATRNSNRPAKMSGPARSLVYRLATETGMRRGDFQHLRVASFDFEQRTVSIVQGSKNGKAKVLPLRADTSGELQAYMATKLPGALAFDMPTRTSDMIRRDLEEAGIPYVNAVGQYADFHSLRHSCGTWLAFSGAHPNVIKDILRHSDIRLTMDRYGHLFDGQSRLAVEALPNLTQAVRKATGTDGDPDSVLASCLALSDAKACTTMHLTAQQGVTAPLPGERQETDLTGSKAAILGRKTERPGFEPGVGVVPLRRFSKPLP